MIFVILECGSILLSKYIRSSSPAILEAVIAVLGSWCSASWPSNMRLLMMQYVAPSHLQHADVAHWHHCATPPCLSLFSTLSSLAPAHFWLVVVWSCLIGGRQKPWCIYYDILFCRSFCCPKRLHGVPYCAPLPTRLSYNIPPTASANFGLIVGCLDQLVATYGQGPFFLSILQWGLGWCPKQGNHQRGYLTWWCVPCMGPWGLEVPWVVGAAALLTEREGNADGG